MTDLKIATDNILTQREIVADLLRRADAVEHSAKTVNHSKASKDALLLCGRVLRVAALQNSPGYVGDYSVSGGVEFAKEI